jgi:tripartite-type tricarboxylate transporter receptor subunit TctC
MKIRPLLCLLGTAITCSTANALAAENIADFPSKAIRLIVPYPPGGGNDSIARIVGAQLTETWSRQIIIDNRPGANTIVGAQIASTSAPDGYTLLVANVGTNAINAALYKKLPYEPLKSFAPVSLLATAANYLVVPVASSTTSLKDLIELAKKQPGKLTYGSSGSGSSQHLAGVMFGMAFQIDLIHVPYKGAGPAMTALVSNQLSMGFATALAAVPHIKSGRLRAIGIASPQRSAAIPEAQPIADLSPGFNATTWWGIVAPAGTPKSITEKISQAIRQGLNSPDVKDKLDKQGVDPRPMTPDEFGKFMQVELDKWAKVVKASGAIAD